MRGTCRFMVEKKEVTMHKTYAAIRSNLPVMERAKGGCAGLRPGQSPRDGRQWMVTGPGGFADLTGKYRFGRLLLASGSGRVVPP